MVSKCIDFELEIIEKEGEPCAKRGKRGGKKQVYRRKGVIEERKEEI